MPNIFADVAQLRKDQDAALAEVKALRAAVDTLSAKFDGLAVTATTASVALADAVKELQAIHKCVCPDPVTGIEAEIGTPTERK